MNSILIVEDALDVQLLIKASLASLPVRLSFAASTLDARTKMISEDISLILLDISLPGQDGIEFCGELQQNERTRGIPVIFLTGNDQIATKVAAFSLGAHDYILKPFNPLELKARIEARLRFFEDTSRRSHAITRGALSLDASVQRAWVQDESGAKTTIQLTPREFKLLFFLANQEERVLSREQILEAVWGNSTDVFDRIIDTHVSAIRKKLCPFGHYIAAVSGSGYRFSSKHIAKSTRRAA